jgi:hypothetical protein
MSDRDPEGPIDLLASRFQLSERTACPAGAGTALDAGIVGVGSKGVALEWLDEARVNRPLILFGQWSGHDVIPQVAPTPRNFERPARLCKGRAPRVTPPHSPPLSARPVAIPRAFDPLEIIQVREERQRQEAAWWRVRRRRS